MNTLSIDTMNDEDISPGEAQLYTAGSFHQESSEGRLPQLLAYIPKREECSNILFFTNKQAFTWVDRPTALRLTEDRTPYGRKPIETPEWVDILECISLMTKEQASEFMALQMRLSPQESYRWGYLHPSAFQCGKFQLSSDGTEILLYNQLNEVLHIGHGLEYLLEQYGPMLPNVQEVLSSMALDYELTH